MRIVKELFIVFLFNLILLNIKHWAKFFIIIFGINNSFALSLHQKTKQITTLKNSKIMATVIFFTLLIAIFLQDCFEQQEDAKNKNKNKENNKGQ